MMSEERKIKDLKKVTEETYLSLVVRDDLKCADQFLGLIGRITRAIRNLNITFKHADVEIFRTVHSAYIRSHEKSKSLVQA